ncbi:MAG: FAD-dependent oxidoreductase [Deltaproteobacteria bacterium]|nr:FAD-dependent oxidoreductase [Deltaproteobacteria bacterium]MBW2303442.1 FAD-dependent oxidoreductase [Deltaproteobacteria bacterium]
MYRLRIVPIETDVLIIGGGLAGCMAAIRAADQGGIAVTLVDKSNTRRSGCAASGIDHVWAYIPPIHEKMGYTIDDMAEDHRVGTAYGFFRRDLFDLVAGTMYERVLDLERFGIRFRYEDSKVPGGFRIVPQFHSVPTSFNFDGGPLKPVLTREAKKRGVRIINRVQMTDLLTNDGRIAGAVGVNVRNADIYFFRAKAVVLSSGRSNRLSRNINGCEFNTRMPGPFSGDGTSMAVRAGLPIINIEFLSNILGLGPCGFYNPNYGDPRNTVQPAARIVDWKGNVIVPRTQGYDWGNLGKEKWSEAVREAWLEDRKMWRQGRAALVKRLKGGEGPFYLDFSEGTDEEIAYIEWSISHEGKGTQFLRYFKGEEGLDLKKNSQEYVGLWPREISGTAAKGIWVDKDLETEIRNLFAAGDEVGGLPWQASPGAFTQGWHAGGVAAGRAAARKHLLPVKDDLVEARRHMCEEILNRKEGFHWREVEIGVQNLMDFYCGDIRSEGLLLRGIERLEDAKAAPLKAENPHELGRCLDVKSIIDNAELVLRSSLERRESRPGPLGFVRADYPEQDDKNWLAFLSIRKREDGTFEFKRLPVDH